jgi:succinate dehydrogenase / fumarate reductase membrane anchor subunit
VANQYADQTTLRSPLGRARGLGSAKNGVHHWVAQRVTSIALLPLTIWFVIAAIGLMGAPHAAVAEWIARPWNAVLLLLTAGIGFYHMAYGLQVILEDYINQEWLRMASILAVKALCLVLALAAALSVLRIAV